MLEGTLPTTRDASPAEAGESVLELREVIERMHAGLRFEKTRNATPNFEVARLKRWRFGSSSESLEATTQAPSSNHPRSTPSWPTPCSGTSRRNRRRRYVGLTQDENCSKRTGTPAARLRDRRSR